MNLGLSLETAVCIVDVDHDADGCFWARRWGLLLITTLRLLLINTLRIVSDHDAEVASDHDVEVASEHDVEVASDHDVEVASEHDVEVASDHDVEVASEHDVEVASDHDVEVASDHDVEVASEHDVEVASDQDVEGCFWSWRWRSAFDHDIDSDKHWCCGLFLRGMFPIMIPRLILSMALRPDSARDDHLLLFMTLEPTSDEETEAYFWWRHWARPASISLSRRWGLLLTLIMMPRPMCAHSNRDAEAYLCSLWPRCRGLPLLTLTMMPRPTSAHSDHDAEAHLCSLWPRCRGLPLLTLTTMPRPTSAHSDHDAEAYLCSLWPRCRGLPLLTLTTMLRPTSAHSDHDAEAYLCSLWPWCRSLPLTMILRPPPGHGTEAQFLILLLRPFISWSSAEIYFWSQRQVLLLTMILPRCLAAISPSRHGGLILTMMIGTEACHDVIETAA